MSKLTIELTPDELKEIIAKHVGSLDYVKDHINPADVEFKLENEWQGYGSNEHQVTVFKGVTITTKR